MEVAGRRGECGGGKGVCERGGREGGWGRKGRGAAGGRTGAMATKGKHTIGRRSTLAGNVELTILATGHRNSLHHHFHHNHSSLKAIPTHYHSSSDPSPPHGPHVLGLVPTMGSCVLGENPQINGCDGDGRESGCDALFKKAPTPKTPNDSSRPQNPSFQNPRRAMILCLWITTPSHPFWDHSVKMFFRCGDLVEDVVVWECEGLLCEWGKAMLAIMLGHLHRKSLTGFVRWVGGVSL